VQLFLHNFKIRRKSLEYSVIRSPIHKYIYFHLFLSVEFDIHIICKQKQTAKKMDFHFLPENVNILSAGRSNGKIYTPVSKLSKKENALSDVQNVLHAKTTSYQQKLAPIYEKPVIKTDSSTSSPTLIGEGSDEDQEELELHAHCFDANAAMDNDHLPFTLPEEFLKQLFPSPFGLGTSYLFGKDVNEYYFKPAPDIEIKFQYFTNDPLSTDNDLYEDLQIHVPELHFAAFC